MSSFGENLQFYRKRENMTQEQLADKLEVSRQTISKWEAGTSYPEMEKILQLCELFSCSMDTLMREDASRLESCDSLKYEQHMEKRRKYISLGVFILIAGVAVYELLAGIGISEAIADTVFMAEAIIAVMLLILAGIEHDNYRKKYPQIPEFYSEQEKEQFDERFAKRIACGIGVILIGFLIGMNGENFPLASGMTEDFYYGIFMLMIAAGVGILVHTGIGKEKYDIASYNKESRPDKTSQKIGVWCGCIMLVATILFLITGFCFNLWHINWLLYAIGGLLCGIVVLILNGKKQDSDEGDASSF